MRRKLTGETGCPFRLKMPAMPHMAKVLVLLLLRVNSLVRPFAVQRDGHAVLVTITCHGIVICIEAKTFSIVTQHRYGVRTGTCRNVFVL